MEALLGPWVCLAAGWKAMQNEELGGFLAIFTANARRSLLRQFLSVVLGESRAPISPWEEVKGGENERKKSRQ